MNIQTRRYCAIVGISLVVICLWFIHTAKINFHTNFNTLQKNKLSLEAELNQMILLFEQRAIPTAKTLAKSKQLITAAQSRVTTIFPESRDPSLSHSLSELHSNLNLAIQGLHKLNLVRIHLENQTNFSGDLDVQLQSLQTQLYELQRAQLASDLTRSGFEYLNVIAQELNGLDGLYRSYRAANQVSTEASLFLQPDIAARILRLRNLAVSPQFSDHLNDPRHSIQIRQIAQQLQRIIDRNSDFINTRPDQYALQSSIRELQQLTDQARTNFDHLSQSIVIDLPLWMSFQLQAILVGLLVGLSGYFGSLIEKNPALVVHKQNIIDDRLRKKMLMAQLSQIERETKTPVEPTKIWPGELHDHTVVMSDHKF